jgi:integrase
MASIRKRSDSSYQITVSGGYDYIGKKITKTKTFRPDPDMTAKQAEKEVQQQAVMFEREVRSGSCLNGGQILFADFCKRWLRDHAEPNLQPKTLEEYTRQINDRIIPALGHIKLEKLQPIHLIEFYNNLKEEGIRRDTRFIAKDRLKNLIKEKRISGFSKATGISPKSTLNIFRCGRTTIKVTNKICASLGIPAIELFIPFDAERTLSSNSILHYHRLISTMLSSAVNWQLITSNIAKRVKSPCKLSKEAMTYDEDMTVYMLELLAQEPVRLRALVSLTVYTGMRLGELAGLEWSDVNFKENLLRIERASQYLTGKGTFDKEPKNPTSKRIIALPDTMMNILKEYRAWQNEERLKCGSMWENSNKLFTQWNGKPIYPRTPSVWFTEFRERNNLPKLTFHQLRHTNASILIAQGVNISTISRRLGHSSPSTTTTIYAHALRRPDREAAEVLDNLFNKNKNEKKVAK